MLKDYYGNHNYVPYHKYFLEQRPRRTTKSECELWWINPVIEELSKYKSGHMN